MRTEAAKCFPRLNDIEERESDSMTVVLQHITSYKKGDDFYSMQLLLINYFNFINSILIIFMFFEFLINSKLLNFVLFSN